MSRKQKGIERGTVAGVILVLAAVMAIIAAFFAVISRTEENQKMIFDRTSQNYYIGLYDKIQISEDGNWFLFPEMKLRFPLTKIVAYDNRFNGRPKYYFSFREHDHESGVDNWELRLSYLENTSSYEKIHFAPLTLMFSSNKTYEIGDIYQEETYTSESAGTIKMTQMVTKSINLQDGRTMYILTYTDKSHYDEQGEHIYKDLLDAISHLNSY